MNQFNDDDRELIAQALATPGWYTLIRTPRGFERIPCTPSDRWEEEGHDSSTIHIEMTSKARRDQAVAGFVPIIGNFHPDLLPDSEDRGEPLPE